jgi:sialate O-acetylesterase
LIRDFRTRFAQGQLPFYFVQLARFEATDSWPRLREAQAELLSEPNTGMVVSLDVGDRGDIHPRNKLEVGRRLAALALARCYGQAVPCEGPTLLSVEIHGSTCRVKFSHAEGLRTSDGAPVRGFQLGGADLGFRGASAVVQGDCVIVECPEVPSPVAVRYAFSDYLAVNLVNGAGLPALPFRTDCG